MGLAQRVDAGPTRPVAGKPCGVGLVLEKLDESEAGALRAMLDDAAWQHTQITAAVKDEGYGNVGASTIGRHRRGECSCGARCLA